MAINIERIIVFIIREIYIRLLQLFKRFDSSAQYGTKFAIMRVGMGAL